MRFQEAHPQGRVKFEHAANDHRDQGLLHFNPVAGHVAVEAVFVVQRIHIGILGARAFVESQGDIEIFVHIVQRIPVVGVPVVVVDQVGAQERAHRAEFGHAAIEFLAR